MPDMVIQRVCPKCKTPIRPRIHLRSIPATGPVYYDLVYSCGCTEVKVESARYKTMEPPEAWELED